MAHFSWRQWLNRLTGIRSQKIARRRPEKLAWPESLEARTLPSAINLIKDINPGAGDAVYTESYGNNLVEANGTLFFVADDGTHGGELWKSDGTSGGTALVKDLVPGSGYGSIGYLTASGNHAFFQFDDGIHGVELWVSDGTANGTFMLKDINPNGDGINQNYNTSLPVDVNGTLYFTATDGTHSDQLWKSDGTTNGTVLVADLTDTGYGYHDITNLSAAGNRLFFVFHDNTHGRELWTSTGTAASTKLVKDIAPQGSGLEFTFYYNVPMVDVQGILFFSADDGTHGTQLWKSNGTEAGTVMITDLNDGDDYNFFHNPVASGNQMFFVFDDGTTGHELWVTDGTAAGAHLVKDINPNGEGAYSSMYVGKSVDVAGTLFFIGNDGVHGDELWKSDGTSNGTVMVADLSTDPGSSASSYFSDLTAVGNTLYFGFDDGTHGLELWKSDGTAAGTVLVQDLNPNGDGFYPGYYSSTAIALDGNLVFVGNNGQTGKELFTTASTGQPSAPVINPQTFSVDENSPVNTVVGTVVASDPASLALHYSISDGNGTGAFSINETTGQIRVADPGDLDFETSSVYVLTVTVVNTADQASSATVTINVNDVNEAPTVTSDTFQVDIHAVHGDSVGTVSASDQDFGQTLTYLITNGNSSDAFAIDPATGEITVNNAAALDLAVNPAFTLSVEVLDNGVPPKQAIGTITINLFDPNDQNDVPVLALNGSAVTFAKKSQPVAIAPNITVTDPDQSAAFRLGGGDLVVSIDLASKKKKIFDEIGGLTGVSAIGSISNQTVVNGRTQLTIHLNDTTTAEAVQNYLRSLTFTTKGAGLKIPTRTLQAQVTDAAGAQSNLLQQTINVVKKPAHSHR